VIHGDDHGASGVPVHNAFQANLFTDHWFSPYRDCSTFSGDPPPRKKAVVA
jgi:hypothetical protein